RTPGEFAQGHLNQARNIDWNEGKLLEKMKVVDPSTPVYVYCLSGGRSRAAAEALRSAGYKQVVELEGGMLAWRKAGLPEIKDATAKGSALSVNDYQQLTKAGDWVLVDVYAPWCGPCKKMAPELDRLASDYNQKLILQKINADDQQAVTQFLGVAALPTLILYHQGQKIWSHSGFLSDADLRKEIGERVK
ncbi:MAG TPA: thioredoxin domain-containing protein, partial [Luteibaculaceae bacterium]|nr:thioredoxin domain-containing protein [Luteibaculaceae bacterium]